jgi:peptidoglycan hydrolase FlgJ
MMHFSPTGSSPSILSKPPVVPMPSESKGTPVLGAGQVASPELREAFQQFVGQTFFSQLISAARTSQKGSTYFNGGQAERIFQSQLDQVLSEKMSEASGEQISEPMLELMLLPRSR